MRLIPESTRYQREGSDDIEVSNGYRRSVPYMESMQGGDTLHQAIRIRQLFEDFGADYLVLDTRNGGLVLYDIMARPMYDDERDVEYQPLRCMNDDGIASRITVEGANECVYAINASQKLNSDIAIDFRRILVEERIDFLSNLESAIENYLPNIKEYASAPDADTQFFYERPFLETQEFISETAGLVYEKKPQTGAIVVGEVGANRKDRYSSVSYASFVASLLERDLLSQSEEYEFATFVN